jgi:hypothetical protein
MGIIDFAQAHIFLVNSQVNEVFQLELVLDVMCQHQTRVSGPSTDNADLPWGKGGCSFIGIWFGRDCGFSPLKVPTSDVREGAISLELLQVRCDDVLCLRKIASL